MLAKLVTSERKIVDIILIFLLCLVIIAVIVRPKEKQKNMVVAPSVTVDPIKKENTNKTVFNLQGPLVCDYSSKESTWSAYIKNKQVYIEGTTTGPKQYFILQGDCLYSWQQKNSKGVKQCGVGQYIQIFEQIQSLGLGNMLSENSSFSFPSQFASKIPLSGDMVGKLMNSCIKKEIKDSYFVLPKEIGFQEK